MEACLLPESLEMLSLYLAEDVDHECNCSAAVACFARCAMGCRGLLNLISIGSGCMLSCWKFGWQTCQLFIIMKLHLVFSELV